MVDKKVGQEKPVKRWSRSKEMLRTLTVASLVARFVDDNLTASGLVKVLDEMAKTVRVDDWEEIRASVPLVTLRSARKDEPIWACDYTQQALTSKDMITAATAVGLGALQKNKEAIQRTLKRIRDNIDAGNVAFEGVGEDEGLHRLLDKSKGVIPGRAVFHGEETWRGNKLRSEPVAGVVYHPLSALVSILFYTFLQAGGWKYLTRCAGCDRLFLPRRPDAHTCSPRCRKRRERSKSD